MAEPNAVTCRENAAAWEAKAADVGLPQLKLSYLASAAAWTERAERLDRTAGLRESRTAAVVSG